MEDSAAVIGLRVQKEIKIIAKRKKKKSRKLVAYCCYGHNTILLVKIKIWQ